MQGSVYDVSSFVSETHRKLNFVGFGAYFRGTEREKSRSDLHSSGQDGEVDRNMTAGAKD